MQRTDTSTRRFRALPSRVPLSATGLVSPLPVVSVEEGEDFVRIVLGGTLFPVGATDVAAPGAADVRALGATLAGVPHAMIAVEGHTDDTGTEAANLTISRLRAEAVGRLLVEGGVSPAALATTGRGETRPVAADGTRVGRARNRR
ncbi:MAG: OmpA family protein, partial [Gemmatimonadetes bacterium]|nr:OmpA family protein [Gemmatimonadota bacterium]